MHTLQLTREEAETLRSVLTNTLSQLHDEIAHTDDRSFRDGLKRDRETITNVLDRLPQQEPIEA